MQLKEKKDQESPRTPARPAVNFTGKEETAGSSKTFCSFVVDIPISDNTSTMKSRVEKAKMDALCPHCSKRIKSAWIIQYHSYQYTQLVYVCSECEQVIRIENAPKTPKESSALSESRLQKRK
jgi:DNA-directed RNA polymerase subunit RPC12/RpoP